MISACAGRYRWCSRRGCSRRGRECRARGRVSSPGAPPRRARAPSSGRTRTTPARAISCAAPSYGSSAGASQSPRLPIYGRFALRPEPACLIADLGVQPQSRDMPDFRERSRKLGGGIVAQPPLKLREDRCAGMAAHADDEGESEPLAIGGVEPLEPGEFLVVEAVETDAALLRPRG